jgi:tetratricopeptide (TPR) repeat protein
LTSPATAASQRDRDDCTADDPGRSIAGCTRILQGRGETAQNRAVAHYNRGNAWRATGDNDRAIADYSEAIRLDPKYASAYNNRGTACRAKGDNDRAIADYSEAINRAHRGNRIVSCPGPGLLAARQLRGRLWGETLQPAMRSRHCQPAGKRPFVTAIT